MTDAIDFQTYLAISHVKARYCRALDTKDWAAFTDVFAEDLDLDTTGSGGTRIQGRDAAVRTIRSSLEHAQTAHQVHSPEMQFDGDAVRVIWAMQDRVIWAAERRPRPDIGSLTGYGHYHERYERRNGEWKIVALSLTRLLIDYHPPVIKS
jgi:hypothetical protein